MMREMRRIDRDGSQSTVWVDDRHVTMVAAERGYCWLSIVGQPVAIKVAGNARDVALTLTGYYDE
jgi:hypothetical protein